MISEIPTRALPSYRSLFPGPHLALVLEAILAGNSAAQCWLLPQANERPVLLLWDKANQVLYLAGAGMSQAALQTLRTLLLTQIQPQACAAGAFFFKTQALSEPLEAQLPALFAGIPLQPYPTLFYVYSTPTVPSFRPPSLPELTFPAISRALLADEQVANRDPVRAEIEWMWPTAERFYAQGFGILALREEKEIIGWCTAEYVSQSGCGIGIATLPAYERQGVATASAAQFVQAALARGLRPHWECGQANQASRRVAEKVGFVLLAEEHYWTGRFQMEHP